MTDTLLHALSVPFALVAGTGAGVLAVLSWQIFRESPFGTMLGVLSVATAAITVYHVVLLAVGPESLAPRLLRSGAYTIVAVFVAVAIRGHRRLARTDPAGDQP